MKRINMLYLVLVNCLLVVNLAQAGIVNNSGTTAEDSLAVEFQLLDTLGNPVQVVSGDSAWIYVWYPGGDLAVVDSVRLVSDAKVATRNLVAVSGLTMGFYTYQNAIADLDGAGIEGVYKWTFVAVDSSFNLASTYHGEFQLYATGNYSDLLDSTVKMTTMGRSLDIAATGEAGVDFSNINGILDAGEIGTDAITAAKIAADAIGASELAASAITSSEAPNLDAAVSSRSTFNSATDSVIVDVSSGHAASGLFAAVADSVWDGPITRDLTTPADYKADVSSLALEASVTAVRDSTSLYPQNDSLQIRRWVWDSTSSKYWGGVGYARVVDTSKVSEGASTTVSDADMAAIADSVLNETVALHTTDGTLGGMLTDDSALIVQTYQRVDSLADTVFTHSPHGDNWASVGASGNGAVSFSLYIVDSSGTVQRVPNAKVSVTTNAGVAVGGAQLSTAAGVTTWNLDNNTAYISIVSKNGYTFPADTFSTLGGVTADSTMGYDIALGTPADPSLKRVWVDVDDITSDSTVAGGIRVCAELVLPGNAADTIAYVTSDSIFIGAAFIKPKCQSATSSGRGRAIFDLIPTSAITPGECLYQFTAYLGSKKVWQIKVPLSGTATENLMKIYQDNLP